MFRAKCGVMVLVPPLTIAFLVCCKMVTRTHKTLVSKLDLIHSDIPLKLISHFLCFIGNWLRRKSIKEPSQCWILEVWVRRVNSWKVVGMEFPNHGVISFFLGLLGPGDSHWGKCNSKPPYCQRQRKNAESGRLRRSLLYGVGQKWSFWLNRNNSLNFQGTINTW